MFTITAATPEFLDEVVANVALDALTALELTLEQVGQETIDYLRSLTEKLAPPIRKGEGPRRKHPGEWADRTTQLVQSYRSEVIRTADSVTLVLSNSAEYAAALEARDGFFVLSGVTDPGGPVEQAFRAVAARLMPDAVIVVEAPGTIPDEE